MVLNTFSKKVTVRVFACKQTQVYFCKLFWRLWQSLSCFFLKDDIYFFSLCVEHYAWNTCEAIKAKSTRGCQDSLVFKTETPLLSLAVSQPYLHLLFLSPHFCSSAVMKSLACCEVFEQTYSSCLGREIFDLSGINLIWMRTCTKLLLFKVRYSDKSFPWNMWLRNC